jgi:hypothetical protein
VFGLKMLGVLEKIDAKLCVWLKASRKKHPAAVSIDRGPAKSLYSVDKVGSRLKSIGLVVSPLSLSLSGGNSRFIVAGACPVGCGLIVVPRERGGCG